MKVKILQDKCILCGMCEIVCPHEVFCSDSETMQVVNEPSCIECGACAVNCPVQAIVVDSGVG